MEFKTEKLKMQIGGNGYITSVTVCGKEILVKEMPFITIGLWEGKEIERPVSAEISNDIITVRTQGNRFVSMKTTQSDICISFRVTEVSDDIETVFFGPYFTTLDEVIGDVIGVVQGKGLAFGVQALNIKTLAGIQAEFFDKVTEGLDYSKSSSQISTGRFDPNRRAASGVDGGSVCQFFCKRRDRLESRNVNGIEDCIVEPIDGPDAYIPDAGIALFGCESENALSTIGEIEIEMGLPHPMINGTWEKISRDGMKPYLISEFSAEEWPKVVETAKKAGYEYIYQLEPFENWGHFEFRKDLFPGGDSQFKELLEKTEKEDGIKVGIHTLSNFMTTNDPYVTSDTCHLLKQGELFLLDDIDSEQTDIRIQKTHYFKCVLTLNCMVIGNEIIQCGKYEEEEDCAVLKGCTRAMYGTAAASHGKDEHAFRLWDYPYRTFYPDFQLQKKFTERIEYLMNDIGCRQISFDGLEGCNVVGQDIYATNRFVEDVSRNWATDTINDASNLNHYTWHIHSRMNWGEPWGEAMRVGQVESRIKNQAFYKQNLFPRMLGWYLLRIAEKKFEASTLEDVEWTMSEAAGFDAGYGMTIKMPVIMHHGMLDQLLESIKNWDILRLEDAFTDEQKAELRKTETEWHLEKVDEKNYDLYPLFVSKPFTCDLSELQPGQPGGSDWSWSTPYPGRFAFRLRVEGDGSITNPSFTGNGHIVFPCTVESGEYLHYFADGTAVVTDKNFKIKEKVQPEGKLDLVAGDQAIEFTCDHDKYDTPDVIIRYITRGTPERIVRK